MLRAARTEKRALLLIDGLDEAGVARARIEAHVATALAGDLMLCTSRPTGLDNELFKAFHRLEQDQIQLKVRMLAAEQGTVRSMLGVRHKLVHDPGKQEDWT